jgi:ribokinase
MSQMACPVAEPKMVALGDAALDIFVSSEHGTVHGSDAPGMIRLKAGGSAANVAVWLARLGARAGFIGALGDDPAGEVLRVDFQREGVIAHLQTVQELTAAIAVLLDEQGERSMVTARGAARELRAEFVTREMLPSGCFLHVPAYSLFAPPLADAALHAAELIRRGGGVLGIDTSSVGPLRAYGRERFLTLLARLRPDLLFANQAEAAYLSGHQDPEAGATFLRSFAGVVIWKLGADGSLAVGSEVVRAPAEGLRAVDTTGAGDAFAAACALALARGRPLPEALACANRLGAAVVQEIGARPHLPEGLMAKLRAM